MSKKSRVAKCTLSQENDWSSFSSIISHAGICSIQKPYSLEYVRTCSWMLVASTPWTICSSVGVIIPNMSEKKTSYSIHISYIFDGSIPVLVALIFAKGSGVTVGSFPPPARWGSLDFKKSVSHPPPSSSPRLLSCLLLLCQLFAEPPIVSAGRRGPARTERMPDRMSDIMSKYMPERMSNRMSECKYIYIVYIILYWII